MDSLEYDDVGEDHDGHPCLMYEGRPVADFDRLLDAYEDSVGNHRATLRSYNELEKALNDAKGEKLVINHSGEIKPVITMRDRLAAMAMQGSLSDEVKGWEPEKLAQWSYRVADAMLREREQQSE